MLRKSYAIQLMCWRCSKNMGNSAPMNDSTNLLVNHSVITRKNEDTPPNFYKKWPIDHIIRRQLNILARSINKY